MKDIRVVVFYKIYFFFVFCFDDGIISVFYGMVYFDFF